LLATSSKRDEPSGPGVDAVSVCPAPTRTGPNTNGAAMPLVSDGDGAHAPDDPSEGTRNASAQYDPQRFVELSRFCRAWVYGLELIANRLVEGQRDDKEALRAIVLGFIDKELDLLDVRIFPHFSKVIAAEMKGAANTELRISGQRPIIEHTAHLVVRDLMQDLQSEIFRRTVDKACAIDNAWFDANYDRICDVIRTGFGDRDTQVELDRLAAQLAAECSTIEMANLKTPAPPDPRTNGSGGNFADSRANRLTVDLAKRILILDGQIFDVESELALRWVKVLADRPGEWVSSRDLESLDRDLVSVRTDKLRRHLPAEILRMIESKTGAGSRLMA
jgi:hypothetical protein